MAASPHAWASAVVTIDELHVADEPARWQALGFAVSDGCCQLGSVCMRFAGRAAGKGIVSWSLRGITSGELDGLPTTISHASEREAAGEHPNGVRVIDHVVAFSPALDRSVRALQMAGLPLRRIREEPTPAGAPRQAFFRLGNEILEVIQQPADSVTQAGGPDSPARLWGVALIAPDLDRTVHELAPYADEPRAAVQEGRRISTLRRSAGLAIPVALMTPARGAV
jgi:hypothetical protein